MIKLLLEPVNLLILDEPTNHLDLVSKEVLKEAIKAFDGTAIIVSHDREFLDGLVEKVYEFGEGKVREHLGGIYDFLQSKKIDSLTMLELSKNASSPEPEPVEKTENKLNYAERKELQKQLNRTIRNTGERARRNPPKTRACVRHGLDKRIYKHHCPARKSQRKMARVV